MTNNKYPFVSNFSELHQQFYEALSNAFAKRGLMVSNDTLRDIKHYAEKLVIQIEGLEEKGFNSTEILKWGNFLIENLQNRQPKYDHDILSVGLSLLIETGPEFCSDYREVFGGLIKKDEIKAEKEQLNQAISMNPESTSQNENATFKI